MKILWIVNTPIRILGEKLYGKRSEDLWMGELLDCFSKDREDQLVVATTAEIRTTQRYEENHVVYYALPGQVPLLYRENEKKNISAWKALLDEEKPDLIQVWGTEFSHGLCALRLAENIPAVVYMQGYLGSIARHYLAGITKKELRRNITLRDICKRDSMEQQQKKYYRSAEKELEILSLADNMICENDWCEDSVRAFIPDIKVYRCPLSINPVFAENQWDIHAAEKHSLICTASGYPLKGLHMVLRAIALLKADYPDIKLYVPGTKMVSDGSLQWLLRKRGYTKYIENLIKKLNIEENIIWMGTVTQEKLAKQYRVARAFVLPSAIENHSSSLKEAMMVGIPSIASCVGGVPEYVRHRENGLLYRFEEYEILASHIKKIFDDDALAQKISQNGRDDMLRLHCGKDIYKNIQFIYKDILSGR